MLKHIMVPLDGSQLAERAIDYACEIVGEKGTITLVSVMDVPDIQVYTMYEVPMVVKEGNYEHLVENLEKSGREYLEAIRKRLSARGITIRLDFQAGDPATVIINRAEEMAIDAIVMSTHGRTGLSRWLFGSVTQKVLSQMPCPVFVINGLEREKVEETDTVQAATTLRTSPA